MPIIQTYLLYFRACLHKVYIRTPVRPFPCSKSRKAERISVKFDMNVFIGGDSKIESFNILQLVIPTWRRQELRGERY
jgi:hypothetical protein